MRYRLIDLFRGTSVTTHYSYFRQAQHTASSLKLEQKERLERFLIFLRTFNPYYSQKLREIRAAQIVSEPYKILQSLPVTDKSFIKDNMGELFSPVRARKYQKKKTGGSTGQPLVYYVDLDAISASWAYMLWFWQRLTGYRPGLPYLTVAGSSLGGMGHRFKNTIYQFLQNNYLIQADAIEDAMHADQNRIKKAFLLYGYPSAIVSIIEKNPNLFRGHRLKAVFTTSEQLMPNVRSYIQAQLKIPVYDVYGANDGGLISCECETCNGFHYNPLNCYVEEFLNEEGQTELLLTSLNSMALPFVRYRVGDAGILGDFGSCKCGSPFPIIQNLLGRTRDLIKLKDGKSIHGSTFNKLVNHFPEIRRYRMIQSNDYSITVYLEMRDYEAWLKTDQRSTFEAGLKGILQGICFKIEKLEAPPQGNQKFEVIKSLVN